MSNGAAIDNASDFIRRLGPLGLWLPYDQLASEPVPPEVPDRRELLDRHRATERGEVSREPDDATHDEDL